MSKGSAEERWKSERVILQWRKEDLKYYKENIGELKQYGTYEPVAKCNKCNTVLSDSYFRITEALIKTVEGRIEAIETKIISG